MKSALSRLLSDAISSILICFLLNMSTDAIAQPSNNAPPSQEAAARLAEAIRIRTVIYDEASAIAPAALAAMRAFLAKHYPGAHRAMTVEPVGSGGTLFCWEGRKPDAAPILLLAHMDVVPAQEQGDGTWAHPAFAGHIGNGVVWGRGAIDMKGQLVAIFEAIEGLASAGFMPERTIYVAIGADEEAGGRDAQAMAALLKARGVRAEFVLDEGPTVIDPFPLTGKRAAFIGIAEKGYGTLLVTARDQGGHSSVPPTDPALDRLAWAIVAIDRMPMRHGIDDTTRTMLRTLSVDLPGLNRLAVRNLWLFGPIVKAQLARESVGRALLGTTIAPTMATGATKENELPSIATARINLRIHPRDRPADLLQKARYAIRGLRDVSVDWAAPPTAASRVASTASAGYGRIADAVRKLAGPDAPIAPILIFGGTDSRYYADVADNAYLFQPYVLTADDLEHIHGIDEQLSIENLDHAIQFFRDLIRGPISP